MNEIPDAKQRHRLRKLITVDSIRITLIGRRMGCANGSAKLNAKSSESVLEDETERIPVAVTMNFDLAHSTTKTFVSLLKQTNHSLIN